MEGVSFCVAVGTSAAYPFVSLRNCKFYVSLRVGWRFNLVDLFQREVFPFVSLVLHCCLLFICCSLS